MGRCDGMPPAHSRGMKLTQPILTTISRQLCHGNPWWALVVLNEYLEPETPLRSAIVALFRQRIPAPSTLADRLCAGALFRDLSQEEQVHIGPRMVTDRIREPLLPRERSGAPSPHARRPPVRRVGDPTPTIRSRAHARQSREVTSKAATAAPALHVVRGVARKLS